MDLSFFNTRSISTESATGAKRGASQRARKTIAALAIAHAILCLSATYSTASEPGDRHPAVTCVYPADVFLHAGQGGRVIDVTKAPFNAKGDGITDDTAALVKAYEFVLAEMDKYPWNPGGPEAPRCEYVIYLPNGTYLVSDTIIYSGPWRCYPGAEKPRGGRRVFERLVRIRFFGQERDKTIIRLKDNCPGFDQGEKAVVSFGKCDLNNAVAYNAFRNISIDTGSGNPAAIGLDFCGANNSGIHNVSVVSGDGQGAVGIDFRICPSMGYHDDITVRGFDCGIRMSPYHMTHNCFEFVTLQSQNKVGVQVAECSTSIRKLRTSGGAAPLQVTTPFGQAVLLDSRLEGRGATIPAIDAGAGHMFVRNVETLGFATAVQMNGKPVVTSPSVDEFVTGPILSLSDNPPKRSLNLPIEETPATYQTEDLDQWANVDRFGAKGNGTSDDAAAVQAAMNSGKPIVYFPKAVYRLASPVAIPASVRRIVGIYGAIDGALHIAEDGPQPLVIEDLGMSSGTSIRHRKPRTLVLSHVHCSYFNDGGNSGAKAFINNCVGLGKNKRAFVNGRFWVRFMNTEFKVRPNFTCNGSDMWVFGYKVEGHMTNFESINGGRLEVLGGACNEHGHNPRPDTPILRNIDSSLCYVGYTTGPNRFETIVEETMHGRTRRLLWADCPPRYSSSEHTSWQDVFVPLYASYSADAHGPQPTDASGGKSRN